ncbi:CDC42 small effector [Chamberlinius hualienensis]
MKYSSCVLRIEVELTGNLGEKVDSRNRLTMGELWVQWFTCCWNEQPQPTKRRRRIDRSMIGEPTNFRHTGHIGSGDMQTGASHLNSSLQYEKLTAIQNQMSWWSSKLDGIGLITFTLVYCVYVAKGDMSIFKVLGDALQMLFPVLCTFYYILESSILSFGKNEESSPFTAMQKMQLHILIKTL